MSQLLVEKTFRKDDEGATTKNKVSGRRERRIGFGGSVDYDRGGRLSHRRPSPHWQGPAIVPVAVAE